MNRESLVEHIKRAKKGDRRAWISLWQDSEPYVERLMHRKRAINGCPDRICQDCRSNMWVYWWRAIREWTHTRSSPGYFIQQSFRWGLLEAHKYESAVLKNLKPIAEMVDTEDDGELVESAQLVSDAAPADQVVWEMEKSKIVDKAYEALDNRGADIVRRHIAGEQLSVIGKDFLICHQRASQIYKVNFDKLVASAKEAVR